MISILRTLSHYVRFLKDKNYAERDVILGVRPEHFIPDFKGGESVKNAMERHIGVDGEMSYKSNDILIL